jgi:2-phosphosulfolactate phosphatase
MRIELHFTPDTLKPELLENRLAVIIDVLRASTTICAALKSGCRAIIPCDDVEKARNIYISIGPEASLLCGERAGEKLPGFDLGNSPAEYVSDIVEGMTLVFASTNGSRTLVKAARAERVVVAGFVNLTLVERAVYSSSKDVVIACSGKLGHFAYEDALCGGALIERLAKSGDFVVANDAARAALQLYKSETRPLLDAISESDHARYLSEIGFAQDLKTATEVDSISVLPEMSEGRISLK